MQLNRTQSIVRTEKEARTETPAYQRSNPLSRQL